MHLRVTAYGIDCIHVKCMYIPADGQLMLAWYGKWWYADAMHELKFIDRHNRHGPVGDVGTFPFKRYQLE